MIEEDRRSNPDAYATRYEEFQDKQASVSRMEKLLRKKREELQIRDSDAAATLDRMKNDRFYELLMNMRALLVRLRFRLRERKFEQANLEQAYRSQTMGVLYSSVNLLSADPSILLFQIRAPKITQTPPSRNAKVVCSSSLQNSTIDERKCSR